MSTATTGMRQASQAPHTLFVALCALFPLTVMCFGTVHASPRGLLAACCIFLGWGLCRAGRYAHSWELRLLKVLTAGALCISALAFVPVSPQMRQFLQPALAAEIEQMFSLVGGGWHPLALDPWRGLIEWSVGVGLVAVGWGAVAWVGRAQRGWLLTWTLVGTGVAVVALAVAQQGMGLQSIYGSGIPAVVREPFFGPFVNPNHGGILCAALVPLALAATASGSIRAQVLGCGAVAILGTGAVMSGSRGAVVALALGVAATLLLAGTRLLRALVVVCLLAALAWVLTAGLSAVVESIGALVAPEVGKMVDAGYVDLTTGRKALLVDVAGLAQGVWPLGVGSAGFDDAFQVVKTTPAFNISTHAHNELLQLVVEHGVMVALCWCGVAALGLRVAIRGIMQSGNRPDRQWLIAGFIGTCVAIAVSAMVDFPLRLGSHGLLAALSGGAALGLARRKRHGARATSIWRRSMGGLSIMGIVALVLAVAGTQLSLPGFSRAQAAVDEGDLQRGLSLLPTHRHAAQLLARDQVRAGEVAAATTMLSAASDLYPTMPWLWRDRARLARRIGDHAAAQVAWRRMLALDLPSQSDPIVYLREAILGAGSADLMAEARAVLPQRADRRREAAVLFQRLGMREEAEGLFKDALGRDPLGVGPYATALLRWGRPGEVLPLLRGTRDGCGTRRLRATALLDSGEYQPAIDAFQAAVAKCGRREWGLQAGLARARLLADDSRGEDLVRRLLIERPRAHKLRRIFLTYLIGHGRPSEAAPHIEHLVIAGEATPGELGVLPRAQRGLPVRLQDLRSVPVE